MAETKRDREAELAALSAEELEQRLREAFFYPDQIDETVFRELEELREALEKKRPMEAEYTAEESWARFLEDRADELEGILGPETRPAEGRTEREKPRTARLSALLRRGLIAAVIIVLLAGAALAAGRPELWAWVPRWNAAAGRFEPAAAGISGESPIPAALAELGITEPVYPGYLPEGFVITESHVSEEPLVLIEQYARGDKRLSITVTPIEGVKNAVYQKGGEPPREYRNGTAVHYVFESDMTVTAIWYTEHYTTTISGNVTRGEIKEIVDSINGRSAG